MGALKKSREREVDLVGLDPLKGEDFVDVPAAVVCVTCGLSDCACEERTQSGVVAIVPWERPGSVLSRLWTTARSTTRDAEGFFHSLPDGQIMPALRFAMLAESLAAGSMLACFGLAFALVFPAFALSLVSSGLAFRGLLIAVPGLALLLVAAHAAHGVALELGTPKSKPTRGLRFGLYACGWDLVIGPFGFVAVALKEGLGSAMALGKLAMGLPGRSARAYLAGAHGLEGEAAQKPLQASFVAAAIATLVSAFLLLGAVVWMLTL